MCGKERERFLENQSTIFKCKITIFTYGECKKCELATLNLHILTYICVGLRKIKVSDGFRKFQMVSEGVGFQVPGFRWFQKE